MSLYNMINGVNPATFFILPMLGHHPDEYPRFRDCHTSNDDYPKYDDHIHIYTRTGGGNREDYEDENDWMKSLDGFVTDFDDSFDYTYASWVFKVPERWADDYAKIKAGDTANISREYREEMNRVFPKLKEKYDELLGALT